MAFDSYYDLNWGKIMPLVDKRHFSEFSCFGGKYHHNQNSTSFYNLKCDSKNEINMMWEDDYLNNIVDQ